MLRNVKEEHETRKSDDDNMVLTSSTPQEVHVEATLLLNNSIGQSRLQDSETTLSLLFSFGQMMLYCSILVVWQNAMG